MRSKLVGAYLTLRYLGLEALVKESLRRVLGKPYRYRGLTVSSDREFRLLRGLAMKGFRIHADKGWVSVVTDYGVLRVKEDDFELLDVLREDFEKQYGVADVKEGIVVDIGAFIEDTVLFFLSRGAKRVYAYEPVRKYHEFLLENTKHNGVENRVIAECKVVWYTSGVLRISVCGAGSGLCTDADVEGFEEVGAVALGGVLSSVSRAEGCVDLVKNGLRGL